MQRTETFGYTNEQHLKQNRRNWHVFWKTLKSKKPNLEKKKFQFIN